MTSWTRTYAPRNHRKKPYVTRRKTSVHRCPPLIRFLTDHPLHPYIHHSPNYHSLLPIHLISLHHSITLHHLIPSHNSTPLHSIYFLHHPPRRITFSTTKTAHHHSLRKNISARKQRATLQNSFRQITTAQPLTTCHDKCYRQDEARRRGLYPASSPNTKIL